MLKVKSELYTLITYIVSHLISVSMSSPKSAFRIAKSRAVVPCNGSHHAAYASVGKCVCVNAGLEHAEVRCVLTLLKQEYGLKCLLREWRV